MWFLDRWSTHMSIHVHRKAFLAIKLLRQECIQFSDVCSLFIRLHLTIDCYDRRRTSWCRHGFQFSGIQILLLIMCIDALESRTNSLSSGFRLMAQVDTNSPKVRRMLFYVSPLIFRIFWPSLHAASRAHRSCQSVSFWDGSSNFGALELRWWGSPGQIIPSDGFWSRMLACRTTALVNRTHRIGFSMFELFRKIDEVSWDTQPNCRAFFKTATALRYHSF